MQPRVSGFTILRNGEKYGYPWQEAIASILPLVDELVIALGDSEDDTEEKLNHFLQEKKKEFPQIQFKVIPTIWDPSIKGGKVLSQQTNLALSHCSGTHWRVYIQADECLHEKDIPLLKQVMGKLQGHSDVEALALSYYHFYGNYQVLNTDRGAYRYEVRIFKPLPQLESFGDAQGFRFKDGSKPKALRLPAKVFHYGYVRNLEVMKEKAKDFDLMFHQEGDQELNKRKDHWNAFEYQYKPGLMHFQGTHPAVIKKRIDAHDWKMDLEGMKQKASFGESLKDLWIQIQNSLPFRIGEYRNYQPVKKKHG